VGGVDIALHDQRAKALGLSGRRAVTAAAVRTRSWANAAAMN